MKPDDIDIMIGIGEGLELSYQEIGEICGRHRTNIGERREKPDHKALIEKVRGWTQVMAAKRLAVKIASVDRRASINDKSYRVVEKGLDQALANEAAEVTGLHLEVAKTGFDRSEGKPLDKKTILSQHTETNIQVHQIDRNQFDELLEAMLSTNDLRARAITVGAIVASPEPTV